MNFKTRILIFLLVLMSVGTTILACAPVQVEEPEPTLELTSTSEIQEMAPRPETNLPIQVEEDIFYKEGRSLDIYAPEEDAAWPIVIVLHGGGGNSKSLSELSSSIASNGAIVFNPTWTSHPPQANHTTKGWEDVACSLSYAHSYLIEKGISDTRVIIVGHSAGGASGFVALVAGDELTGECSSSENPLKADAFVSLDGATNILDHVPASRLEEGDPDEWERINPYHYLDETHFRENVDIVLMTSYEEEMEQEAVNFKEEIERVGFSATHIRMPEFDHWGVATPYPEVMEIIMDIIYPN